ncbi:MAG TPA: hypothetical protein VKE70_35480 [Candidatus Solibacter sp.]|nr:hypothetical protein [Candidatus Solibacter sp.]
MISGNYGISLLVTGLALHYRSRATFVKGVTMGRVGVAALLANALSFALLWRYRGWG